jgi:hypothetical protein
MTPVTPITLEDASKNRYAFRPQSDMTALEAALICQLFTKMTLNRSGDALDWPAYVQDHRLWRHFTPPLGEMKIPEDAIAPGAYVEVPSDAPLPKMITIQNIGQPELSCTVTDDMPIPDGWRVVPTEKLIEEAGAGGVK